MIDLKNKRGSVIKFNCTPLRSFFLSVIIWETNRSNKGLQGYRVSVKRKVSSMNREKRRWIRNVRHSSPRWLFIRCSYLSAMNDRRHAWLKTFPLDRPRDVNTGHRFYYPSLKAKRLPLVYLEPREPLSFSLSLSLSLPRIDRKKISTIEINISSCSSLIEYTVWIKFY